MAKRRSTWEPSRADLASVVGEQNPWHGTGAVPEALAFTNERALARGLAGRLGLSTSRRFQVVLGPRRVGKTTCLYQCVRHLLKGGLDPHRAWWFRVDHPLFARSRLDHLVRAAVDGSGATPASPVYLFLDELVSSPDWDRWLKTFYDDHWPVRIAASSSATAALRQGGVESGVGRWDDHHLMPYLFDEFLELIGTPIEIPSGGTLADTIRALIDSPVITSPLDPQRRRYILTGGFPELLSAHDERSEESRLIDSQRTLFKDAVERTIYKDIPQAFQVNEPALLQRVLYVLGGQIGNILSPTSLCQQLAGLSKPTLERYIGYMERSFLIFTLSPYSRTEEQRQRRGKKLYFVDSAVRNAALERGLGPLRDRSEMGVLLENTAATHLHTMSRHAVAPLNYWRSDTHEVDLVVDHPSHPLAFEIAHSAGHSRGGLYAFVREHTRFAPGCYLVAPDAPAAVPDPSSGKIGTLPLDVFLLAVGAQSRRFARERF